jgi:hypothetical protein
MDGEKLQHAEIAWDIIQHELEMALKAYKAGETYPAMAIMAKRLAQKADPMKRKRIVIAYPKWEAVAGKLFTPNLLDNCREMVVGGIHVFVAIIDLPSIDVVCQRMIRYADSAGRSVLSGDVSGYDASVPPWLITDIGKDILAPWLGPGGWLPIGLTETLANQTALITPTGVIPAQPSSMKSGSSLTNIVDSLGLLTVLFYGEEMGFYKLERQAVQGDDFIADGPGVVGEAISEAFSHFGMVANADKQFQQPHALSFLQRTHYRDWYGGISSVMRTLGSILSLERYRYRPSEWNWAVDCVRAISQLDNCKFHPAFVPLVEFIKKGDKYELGANMPASSLLSKSGDTGKEVIQRDQGASWKSGANLDGFSQMVVNRVLRGESFPPQGSREYFVSAYGSDRLSKQTVQLAS